MRVWQKIAFYRRTAARALVVAGFGSLCLSAYLFLPAPRPDQLDEAFWIMLAGGLTSWAALWLNRKPTQVSHVSHNENRHQQGVIPRSSLRITHYLLLALGLAAFLILIEINTGIFGVAALQYVSSHIQFALFLVGLVGITLALSGLRLRFFLLSTLHLARSTKLSPQSFVLSPLLWITLLALLIRAYALSSAVHHFIDEIHFSNAVVSIRQPASTIKLLWPINSITAFPWLFSYMQAWGVTLLGRNLEGLRAISVVLGTLGIPALYFLARELLNRKTALLAAFLLAVFPPHIQFSRIGLNNIADPLFGTLALAFLIRGLKYQRRLDFALGGAALGLTQYFYEGGRFLFPTLIVLTLIWFILVKPRFFIESGADSEKIDPPSSTIHPFSSLSPQSSVLSPSFSLVTFFLTAILIALPVYITILATGHSLDSRFETVGIGGSYWLRVTAIGVPQSLEQHLVLPFLVYVHKPETALYYGGEQAMLLPYVVPFVMLGAFALIAYLRTPGLILVLWVLLTSLGNMLLTESAIYARYVVAFPALMVLAAVGIRTLAALMWPGGSRWRGWAVGLLLIVLVLGQITYFFGPHLGRYNEQIRQTFDSEDAIFRSTTFPWGTQIHILTASNPGQVYLFGIANYLTDGLSVFVSKPLDVTPAYLSALSRGVDQAFFLEPFDTTTVNLLKQQFVLEGPFTSPYNLPTYRQLLLYYAKATGPQGNYTASS
jgi:hypothetical protein